MQVSQNSENRTGAEHLHARGPRFDSQHHKNRTKMELYDPAIPLLGMHVKEMKSTHRHLPSSVHCSLIQNREEIKATQSPSADGLAKKMQPLYTIVFSQEGMATCHLQQHRRNWSPPNPHPVLSKTSQARHGETDTDDLMWNLEKLILQS